MTDLYQVHAYEPIQIMPAKPGWVAVFRDSDGSETEGDPVVMWALCRHVIEWRRRGVTKPVRMERCPKSIEPIIEVEGFLEPACEASNYAGVRRAGASPEAIE